MSFTFVRIPCDASLPLVECSGGASTLEADALKAAVGAHFAAEEAAASPGAVAALDAARAADVRASFEAAGAALTAAAAAGAAAARRLVDITLLTVPRAPAFESVSLYADPDAGAKGRGVNARATALAHAAGHPPSATILGDAFLGRSVDDEAGDVWARVSIMAEEAAPDAPWVRAAAAANAGRSVGGFSTSGLLAQMQGGGAGGGGGGSSAPAAGGARAWRSSAPDDPLAYSWRRASAAEIELRQPLPPATRARDIEVVLKRDRLGARLRAAGAARLPGALGEPGGGALTGKVDVESSSWAVEDGALVVALALVDTGAGETSAFAWPRVFAAEL